MQKRSFVLVLVAAAALMIPSLGGCALTSNAQPAAPSPDARRSAAEVLPDMEAILPELLALGGEGSPLAVRELREESCLDPVQDDNWNTETRPLAWALGRYADHEAAQTTMDAWKNHLAAEHWVQDEELRNDPGTNGDVQVMRYHRGDLRLSASYDHAEADGSRVVDVLITGPCTKSPEDHQMIRSKLDPHYGLHSQYYDYAAEQADSGR